MIARLALAGVLAAALLPAQRGGRGLGNEPMTMPVTMTPSRLDTIGGILKLDKEQKKQVKTVLDDGQKEAAPVRDQIVKGELDIGEAAAAGKGQDEIDKAINALSTLAAQMAAIEMKAFARIYLALDKEQQPNAGRVFYMMQGIFKTKNWNEAQP